MQFSTQPWELDTRHLAALRSIASTRSISRAAIELGYGQSAVSQQLAALEKTVGQRLFDRGTGPRPVTLTAAGEALLPHAQWILDRLQCAQGELEQLDTGKAGSIRIGTFQSAGARLLPPVLATFRQQWPNISVSIHDEPQDSDLATLVRTGTIDVAFAESGGLGPGLEHCELFRDSFVVLVPPSHHLATSKRISLLELAGEDFIEGAAGNTCTTRSEQAIRAVGLEQRVVFRTDDNPTRQRLVDAGLGCAVVPGLTVERGLENGAVMVPLVEDIHRTICLVWSSERAPSFALSRFVEIAPKVIATRFAVEPTFAPSVPRLSRNGSRSRNATNVPTTPTE
jgi:DNA-binding transcriptional LysR family regulator